MPAKLKTFTEIQESYGLKKNTLTKMYMRGEFIDAIKIGNRNYFRVDKLEEWINDHEEKSEVKL